MKKIFLIIVSFVMILNFSLANMQEDCGRILVKMNLLAGYPDGTLKLENNITRAEFCTLIIKMVGKNETPIESRFSDVKEEHWAYGVINRAAELGYLSGYEDGTFRPSNNITYAESCSILVNLLGYKDEIVGTWPISVTDKANELNLNINLEGLEPSHIMTRGEVSIMLVNSMNVKFKGDI